MPWRCYTYIYIYIRSNIRNVQFIIVYLRYHTSKFFPCCFWKNHFMVSDMCSVFVHHMIDHGHSSITVLACVFFIYDILCVSVSTKKLHQSAHVCHVWTVDTANQQIHSISVMCFFTWLICLGFPGTVCPNSYGNKTKYHVSHGKRSMWSIRNSAVLKTSLGADAMCGAGGLLWMCHWVRWWSY